MSGKVRGLGEIALRVEDIDAMQVFYEDVIGLEVMRRTDDPPMVFFRIADGFEGHTQVLALFNRSGTAGYAGLSAEQTTVDHIAFTISAKDYETEKARLEHLGLAVDIAEHAWVRWRSLYVNDPEGNRVELVCSDDRIAP